MWDRLQVKGRGFILVGRLSIQAWPSPSLHPSVFHAPHPLKSVTFFRQSFEPEDLFHAHVGGMDTLARALLVADRILTDGKLPALVDARYAGWKQGLGTEILDRKLSLEQIADRVKSGNIDPKPRSGRQEMLENLVSRYL